MHHMIFKITNVCENLLYTFQKGVMHLEILQLQNVSYVKFQRTFRDKYIPLNFASFNEG